MTGSTASAPCPGLLDEYRAGGLAVLGPRDTLAELDIGEADELLVSAALEQFELVVTSSSARMTDAAPAGSPPLRGGRYHQRLAHVHLLARAGDRDPSAAGGSGRRGRIPALRRQSWRRTRSFGRASSSWPAASGRARTSRPISNQRLARTSTSLARVRVIEAPALLAGVGGVGAFLRCQIWRGGSHGEEPGRWPGQVKLAGRERAGKNVAADLESAARAHVHFLARVRVIEVPALLAGVGGVGALLRCRI